MTNPLKFTLFKCFDCLLLLLICPQTKTIKGFIQDEGAIICPECARKKMLEEMEEENQE